MVRMTALFFMGFNLFCWITLVWAFDSPPAPAQELNTSKNKAPNNTEAVKKNSNSSGEASSQTETKEIAPNSQFPTSTAILFWNELKKAQTETVPHEFRELIGGNSFAWSRLIKDDYGRWDEKGLLQNRQDLLALFGDSPKFFEVKAVYNAIDYSKPQLVELGTPEKPLNTTAATFAKNSRDYFSPSTHYVEVHGKSSEPFNVILRCYFHTKTAALSVSDCKVVSYRPKDDF